MESRHRPVRVEAVDFEPVSYTHLCQSPAQPGIGESNRSNAGRTSGKADQRFKEVVGDLCGTVINQPQQSQRRTGFTPVECLERGR